MKSKAQILECDIAIIGGGLGGVAAALAAFCAAQGVKPRQVREEENKLRAFQDLLRERGTLLEWSKEALEALRKTAN